MLFGNKQIFAIEAMFEPEANPPKTWGRMQVWCNGVSIGDFSERNCALFPAYSGFKDLIKSLPKQWISEFETLSDLEIWNRLDWLLYGPHGDAEFEDVRTVEDCRNDWNKYGHFNFLTNWGEQFDSNKGFILCQPDGNVKIVYQSFPAIQVISFNAPLYNVETAIQDFVKWFDDERFSQINNI